ncbi:MAG TPA: TIGR01459 family HAD-type hydrolase [Magnetospirillaceae bacterium]|nr:TIGR01459 family HAD-type hydrolase [Magnetospirillaceae bacterium]
MTALPILPGFEAIADRYDGFILDLWGLIHDGHNAYPGAADTLKRLQDKGKRVVMLSNSPRRAESLKRMMERLGIGRDHYNEVMSSGEAVFQELLTRADPWFARLGKRCLLVGVERDRDLLVGLDLTLVETPDEADFILNTGPDGPEAKLEDYTALLDRAAQLTLPMICANPDLVVMVDGLQVLCAGALAAYYQQKGGQVRYRGKPDPAIYQTCFSLLRVGDKSRILGVGDAFHTDMAGAVNAGIDGLFCSGGIHAEELETRYGQPPDPARLKVLAASYPGIRPVAAIGGLVW